MLSRKTQYAWMALGGFICLLGLVLACKLRDGNKAIAQPEKLDAPLPLVEPPPPPLTDKEKTKKDLPSPKISTPPPEMINKPASPPPASPLAMPDYLSPPKSDKLTAAKLKDKPSEPKATLSMPFPAVSGAPSLASPPTMPPSASAPTGSVLPASFGPNTPTPPTDKKPESKPGSVKHPIVGAKEWDRPPETTPPTSKPDSKPESTAPPKKPADVEKPKLSEKKSEDVSPPRWNVPTGGIPSNSVPASEHESVRTQPGEPPLAPAPGPVQLYHVHGRETLRDIAQRTLGSSERWGDLHKLNPTLSPESLLSSGTTVRLPADACVQADDAEPVKPLPALRPKPTAPKARVLPLTGTYQCSLDEQGQLTLPRALRDQLNRSDTVLLSPGPDKCLWLTNQPHLERLGERLEQSQANEADVRVFKRLYFAQTEKLAVNGDGRVAVPERLREFAGLHQEVVLVGIDDHFEVWDAARWRSYTQQKGAGRSAALSEPE